MAGLAERLAGGVTKAVDRAPHRLIDSCAGQRQSKHAHLAMHTQASTGIGIKDLDQG